MPLFTRVTLASLLLAGLLPAQEMQSMVPVGDITNWATVGAILTALSYGSAKLLDKMRR